jgi:hypothetical protein
VNCIPSGGYIEATVWPSVHFLDVTGNERFGEPSISKVTIMGAVAMMQHLKKLQFLRQRALHFLFILG